MRLTLNYLIVFLLIALTDSCTVQKRLYRRGYTISWNHRYKSENENGRTKGVNESVSADLSKDTINAEVAIKTQQEQFAEIQPIAGVSKEVGSDEIQIKSQKNLPPQKIADENDNLSKEPISNAYRKNSFSDSTQDKADRRSQIMTFVNMGLLVLALIGVILMIAMASTLSPTMALIIWVLFAIASAVAFSVNVILGISLFVLRHRNQEVDISIAKTIFQILSPALIFAVLSLLGLVVALIILF